MARSFLTPINLNKLELQNAAIQNLATPPGTPTTGQIYYDTSTSPYQVKIWNGTTWVPVGNSQEEIEDFIAGLIDPGTGIGVNYDDNGNSLVISNTGVLSILGTTNEIDVSASTGAVTLSLPSTINANLNGNASTATTLETARVISLTGDASGSVSFNGSANVSIPVVISAISGGSVTYSASAGVALSVAPDSVALGTGTTGNYVADLTQGTGITVSGGGSEGANITVTNSDRGSSQNIFKTIIGGTGSVTAASNSASVTITGGTGISTAISGSTLTITNTDVGSSQNIFKNVAVSGQNTVVADSNNDTLTFAGSTGLTITTNDTTDTVTFTNSGVTSVAGTTNQVNVSGSTGAVTFSLPQSINTTAEPVFGGATLGNIRVGITGDNEIDTSTGNLTIDSTGGTVTVDDNLIITGNLTVSGSTTYINTQILEVADNLVILNSDVTGTPTENAGIEVERGTSSNVSILWNETDDRWTLTNDGTNFAGISRKFSQSLTGSSTSYTVTHNLNTRDVVVNVYSNSTPWETVETDVERTDANTVTIRFASAPTSGAYSAVVIG